MSWSLKASSFMPRRSYADVAVMSVNDYVLARGIRDTRSTLEIWQRDPGPVLAGWLAGAFAIGLVVGVTPFSLLNQMFFVGTLGASISAQLDLAPVASALIEAYAWPDIVRAAAGG